MESKEMVRLACEAMEELRSLILRRFPLWQIILSLPAGAIGIRSRLWLTASVKSWAEPA